MLLGGLEEACQEGRVGHGLLVRLHESLRRPRHRLRRVLVEFLLVKSN